MIDDFRGPDSERKRAKLDGFRDNLPSSQPNAYGSLPEPGNQTDDQPFRTPEEVSQSEQTTTHASHDYLPGPGHHLEIEEHANKPRGGRLTGIFRKPNLSKKQWILVVVAAIVLLGAGGALAYKLTHKPQPAPVAKKAPVKVVEKPKPIISPLSGLVVTAEQQARPVTGVMIENSPDARPQSGLDQSSVVFEAIAEAGITRFLALYQDNYPGTLGPVRSSRPYYLDWAMAFDATYAHVGGSPDALQRIKDIGVKDLDQFFNPGPYHRISSRYAPHNMYTSLQGLADTAAAKGYTSSTFTPLPRKEKEEPSATPTAKSINFGISGAFYNVHYDYDPASNSYKRSEGGSAHIDNETKAQLSPKVVVALAMPYSLMADGYHSNYQTIGSGQMLVFQDGVVIPGTWSKAAPKDQFIFKVSSDKELKLNPGQTWFTVVTDISKATYQP
jgi:hypothetical protein